MRITIDKGFQPLIREVMAKIHTDDPRLALNHIISTWAMGQQTNPTLPSPPQQAQVTELDDEFSQLTDWS
ncbi:hypothetical protein Lepto7375DRAFT_4582 [Leptolyngbya sp. PCC 7375]|nr:hypothetical protein Lepto7375DRAFT_4582 [Leptolyngbya sp. PCC 7375]